MKRRNADLSKLRRPMKSKKITEGVYASVFGYLKFLAVWGLVLLADFILEFRFEYLYPVWLLIRTVHDSYKYQGVLLTMLFLIFAIGSDILCYVFVPVQWLFFAASSYVWVQYVWHTDKGVCISSVSLWLIFVYVEAALRMKDQRSLPFNMDLCRPFAAHCIGYPVVTIGYGMKTAATESLRRRTISKVKKSNQFYTQLLQDALPPELRDIENHIPDNDLKEDLDIEKKNKDDGSDSSSDSSDISSIKADNSNSIATINHTISPTINTANTTTHSISTKDLQLTKSSYIEDYDINAENEARERRKNINDLNEDVENILNDNKSKVSKENGSRKLNNKRNKTTNSSTAVSINASTNATQPVTNICNSTSSPLTNGHIVTANGDTGVKPEYICRLEADVKRLKADLQASKNTESELKTQLLNKTNDEKQKSVILLQLQQDNDNLQNKLHNLVMSKQQDKQNLAALEKKYQEEKKLREKNELQLASERKAKKDDQTAAAKLAATTSNKTTECSGTCKTKLKELEDSMAKLKWDIERKDEQIRQLEYDAQMLRKFKEANTDKHEVLMSVIANMQERTAHLENSLSAENKIKMDLFSALGEVKRQIEIQRRMLATKDAEIAGLRSHITEALALVPSSIYTDQSLNAGQYTTPRLGSPTLVNCGQPFLPGLPDMMYPHCMAIAPSQHITQQQLQQHQQQLQQQQLQQQQQQRYSPPQPIATPGSSSPARTPSADTDCSTNNPTDFQASQ